MGHAHYMWQYIYICYYKSNTNLYKLRLERSYKTLQTFTIYQSFLRAELLMGTTGTFFPWYPKPFNQGHVSVLRCSNASIAAPLCIVNAMSSRPFKRQCLRKGSILKGIGGSPFTRLISSFSRSTSKLRPSSASLANSQHCSWGMATGSIPFCIELLRKISAKLGAITHRIPKSFLYAVSTVSVMRDKLLTNSKARAHGSSRSQNFSRCKQES